MNKQGYQIVALGSDKYLEMALSCALSIRHFDSVRPIQLLTNRNDISDKYKSIFDHVDVVDFENNLIGPLVKIVSYKYKRFKNTMFVDCDCLMFENIDHYWSRLESFNVACLGTKKTSGPWYDSDISDMCSKFDIPYVVKTNSGMLYFTDHKDTKNLFDRAWDIWEKFGNFTNHIHRGMGAPDEPYIGVAYGMERMTPMSWVIDKQGRGLMQSTISAINLDCRLDGTGVEFEKNGATARPAIVHFVGSKPLDKYLELSNFFRKNAGFAVLDSLG